MSAMQYVPTHVYETRVEGTEYYCRLDNNMPLPIRISTGLGVLSSTNKDFLICNVVYTLTRKLQLRIQLEIR